MKRNNGTPREDSLVALGRGACGTGALWPGNAPRARLVIGLAASAWAGFPAPDAGRAVIVVLHRVNTTLIHQRLVSCALIHSVELHADDRAFAKQ
jgi:hypothetical protein